MTDKTSQPAAPAPPPQPPSFARRHPILTGFGILAGVSLFAAYFPISAIVTAVIVGGRATGADRLALHAGERAVRWIGERLHRTPAHPPAPPTPADEWDVFRLRQHRRQRSVERTAREPEAQLRRTVRPVTRPATKPPRTARPMPRSRRPGENPLQRLTSSIRSESAG